MCIVVFFLVSFELLPLESFVTAVVLWRFLTTAAATTADVVAATTKATVGISEAVTTTVAAQVVARGAIAAALAAQDAAVFSETDVIEPTYTATVAVAMTFFMFC